MFQIRNPHLTLGTAEILRRPRFPYRQWENSDDQEDSHRPQRCYSCRRTLNFANEDAQPPELTYFDLAGLISDIGTDIAAGETQTGMIENSVPLDFDIFADRDQLYRAISNLVLNAFQAGATKVGVTVDTQGETISVRVADNGPGLPDRVREHLFEPFRGSTRVGGTGLGLSLIRGHGGDVALESTGGDGTAFVFTLPVEERRERARFARTATSRSGGAGLPANAAE